MFEILLLVFLLDVFIFCCLGGVKLSGSSAESIKRSTRKGLDGLLEIVLFIIEFLLNKLHTYRFYHNIY